MEIRQSQILKTLVNFVRTTSLLVAFNKCSPLEINQSSYDKINGPQFKIKISPQIKGKYVNISRDRHILVPTQHSTNISLFEVAR